MRGVGRRMLARMPWLLALRFRGRLQRVLAASGLFDAVWYATRYPDVRGDPLRHFLRLGLYQGRDPGPFFSTAFYRERNPDIAAAGLDPLTHYVFFGGAEGRIPHPLVTPGWLGRVLGPDLPLGNPLLALPGNRAGIGPRPMFDMARLAAALGLPRQATAGAVMREWSLRPVAVRPDPHVLFDSAHVRAVAGLAADADAVDYYCRGFGTDVSPHPLFDPDHVWFMNPAVHHLPLGLTLLDAALTAPDPTAVQTSVLFDNDHYLAQVGDTGSLLPVVHYLQAGGGADPHPLFDDAAYGARYGRERAPLDHYLRHGCAPGVTLAPRFDDAGYVAVNPDAARPEHGPPLRHHLDRARGRGFSGGPAWTDPFDGWDRVKADLAAGAAVFGAADPEVSVIVPVYDQFTHTLRCLWSILQAGDAARLQVIVADDGSSDETRAFFGALPGVTYIRNPQNMGFLRSCNTAALSARAPYLFFLNNDTAVLPGWIDRLLDVAHGTPEAGIVGSKLVYPDGRLQEAGGFVWADGGGANLGRNGDPGEPGYNLRRDADYISGAAILVPAAAWAAAGGFDDRYAPAYCEDTDLAMRLRQLGWRVIYQPSSVVVHFEGVSSGTSTEGGVKAYQVENFRKLRDKWAFALETHVPAQPIHPRHIPRPPRPRILVIDHIVPQPDRDAGSLVMDWHLRLLVQIGYDVTFLPRNLLPNGAYGDRLRDMGVELIHAPYVRWAARYLEAHARDFDAFYLCRFAEGGAFIEQIRRAAPGVPVIFAPADLHFLRAEREALLHGGRREAMAQAAAMQARELAVVAQADVTMVVSTHEAEVLRALGHDRLAVVPLVMPAAHGVPGRAGRAGIAFVGGFRHAPNAEAVRWFLREVWPLLRAAEPGLAFHIVGSDPPPELRGPGVVVEGFVADLDGFLAQRIATVAPLTFGAGIKGKVGSSLAQGVPVVGTRVAVEGMGLAAETEVLVADRPADFAAAVLRLVRDGGLWAAMSAAGLAFVAREYSPEVTTGRLLALLEQAGAAPFGGTCPVSGQVERRRLAEDGLAAPGGPGVSDRVAAAALARLAGQPGVALAALERGPGPVAVQGLPAVAAALAARRWRDDTAPLLAARLVLDDAAGATLAGWLAAPQLRRLVLACPPAGGPRADPARIGALVRQAEAAGWQVRTDRMPLKDSALTGTVLIEARR